jgi:6-pyruvoyltetrahydropterin/6-carboxytetrahydropterin synthase
MSHLRPNYHTISIRKQAFKFSCGHFTLLSGSRRELLHGHDYFISFELDYPSQKFIDYNIFKNEIKILCQMLDEKVIIPSKSKHLKIKKKEKNIEITFNNDFFSLPSKDILLLPIENSTLEELSHYIFSTLAKSKCYQVNKVRRLKIIVENCGQKSMVEGFLDE